MIKRILYYSFLLVLITALAYSNKSDKEKEKEDLEGRRKLPHKVKITAEGRYSKLIRRIKVLEDKNDICNQLLYIENGYWDHGYLPEQKQYFKHKDIPEGFWVYVYPYWYIWEEQQPFK